MPIAPEHHITQSDHELHVGLPVPRNTAKQIHNWVKEQDWPEGTELEHPNDYHVTLLYTPEGQKHKDAWWMEHLDHAPDVKLDKFHSFPQGPDGVPYVLKIDSPEITQHATMLQNRAEAMGLPITHFPGGYTPHLTVGYGPQEVTGLKAPNFQFDLGPSSVSSTRPPKTPEDPPITASFKVEPWDPHADYRSATLAEIIGHTSGEVERVTVALRQAGYPTDEITLVAAVQTWAIESENLAHSSGDLSQSLPHTQTRCLNCQSPLVNGACLHCSTVPSEVNNPDDHWNPGPLGEPPDKHHDVQIGNDWALRTV